MTYFFLILTLMPVYADLIRREPKLLMADPGCLNELQLNLNILNERLSQCQKPTKQKPSANLDKLVEVLCEYLADDVKCYKNQYNSFKKCLEKEVAKKYYMDKIHEFNAGRTHRCMNDKKNFRNFNSPKGTKCLDSVDATLPQCDKINFTIPWTTLKTIDFPPEVKAGETPKTEVNVKECRLKGLWLMCVVSKLDACSDKTARNYFKGYHGAMLAASECKAVIEEEFPTLAYTGELPQRAESVVLTLNLYCFVLSFISFVVCCV